MKPLLNVLAGNVLDIPPIWLMRQTGRYLSEHQKIKAQVKNFMSLCLSSSLAADVTLLPINRFKLDAAILFSDILMVPYALGQNVQIEPNVGPQLGAFPGQLFEIKQEIQVFHERLAPVYETIKQVKDRLPADVALIGFAGAPWTVATYMVEQGPSKDFSGVKAAAFANPQKFQQFLMNLAEYTLSYLEAQVNSGAEVIQLFDSWAGAVPADFYEDWVIKPTAKIVSGLKERFPDLPIIGFPKGSGILYEAYFYGTGVTALSLDSSVPLSWALQTFSCPLQGNLDPALALVGGDVMKSEVQKILKAFAGKPFIFNLGHGVNKETPPENIQGLVDLVRS